MVLDAVLERFIEQAPVAVMARLSLQHALSAEWVDATFETHRETQSTRELLFSSTVDLMALVAVGLRPSLHAAMKQTPGLAVSVGAIYEKVRRVEPAVLQALVAGSAARLAAVMAPLRGAPPPWLAGWRVRVVDGNHLAATDKRLGPLRGVRGAARPGQALVVFDPELGLVTDVVPCEDAHASERVLFARVLATAQPRELWIADRNFCTGALLRAAAARRTDVRIREHAAHPNAQPTGPRRRIGRVETGVVYEQAVTIPADDGGALTQRRIEVELDAPTEAGDTTVRLLTTRPATVRARAIARFIRKRWTIEAAFGRLEAALQGEVRTLGHPRAALFAFALALVAFNVLAVIEAAVAAAHDLDAAGLEVSTYYVADDVTLHDGGMMIAVVAATWATFEDLTAAALARTLRQIAAHIDPRTLRKHPRGPKTRVRKGYAPRAAVQRHVATARVLRDGGIVRRP